MRAVVHSFEVGKFLVEVVEVTPPTRDVREVYLIQRRLRRDNGDITEPQRYGQASYQSIAEAEIGGREWCGEAPLR